MHHIFGTINWNGIVSLLLFCMEFVLLINLLIFAEKNKTNVMGILLVALLAVYQLIEFLISRMNLRNSGTVYLAFAAISFLPPLNLALILKRFHKEMKWHKLIFLPAIFFIVYYFFVIDKFSVTGYSAFYASYNYPLSFVFGLFYYIPLLISIVFLFFKLGKTNEKIVSGQIKVLLSGLIFIFLPVILAFILLISNNNSLLKIIESVMCKFAFVYAICVAYFILLNKKVLDERNHSEYILNNK